MLAVLIGALWIVPAGATTLIRQSLESLVADHSRIVVGEVLEAHSYWNRDGTSILTDVRFAAGEIVKGNLKDKEFTITLVGGRVGGLTTVLVGGAELVPGRSYLLFLNEQNLAGAKGVLTVREHVQGAFDIQQGQDGPRAVSHPQGKWFPCLQRLGAEQPQGWPLSQRHRSQRSYWRQPDRHRAERHLPGWHVSNPDTRVFHRHAGHELVRRQCVQLLEAGESDPSALLQGG